MYPFSGREGSLEVLYQYLPVQVSSLEAVAFFKDFSFEYYLEWIKCMESLR